MQRLSDKAANIQRSLFWLSSYVRWVFATRSEYIANNYCEQSSSQIIRSIFARYSQWDSASVRVLTGHSTNNIIWNGQTDAFFFVEFSMYDKYSSNSLSQQSEMYINVWSRPCSNHMGQKFHSSASNYEWNLEKTSNSSQSTHPVGRVLWKELLEEVILHITLAYALKGQVHVFAGRVKVVSHSSCRTSAILKFFVPWISLLSNRD